jgi:hypothetical protein
VKYFIDTEFSERGAHQPIDLISIAVVAEDGREFYAVSSEFNAVDCNPWVVENVLPHLGGSTPVPLDNIGYRLERFCWEAEGKPSFWGYYSDYDWVVLCQVFGAMVNLPKGWPRYCHDLKQWCVQLGDPKLPKQDSTEHNALHDARWNKQVWEFLNYIEMNKALR